MEGVFVLLYRILFLQPFNDEINFEIYLVRNIFDTVRAENLLYNI